MTACERSISSASCAGSVSRRVPIPVLPAWLAPQPRPTEPSRSTTNTLERNRRNNPTHSRMADAFGRLVKFRPGRSTKPGRAGRASWWRRETLARLQGLRVRDAGEERVADRRDELRRDTNVCRLFVVVRIPDQFWLGPASADERDPERQPRVVSGRHRDVGVAGHSGGRRRAHEELEVTVEVTLVRIVVGRPGWAVRQGDDRVEVVVGHERID